MSYSRWIRMHDVFISLLIVHHNMRGKGTDCEQVSIRLTSIVSYELDIPQ